MPRDVAFLRGVSPVNAKMPELKHCFEQAGFVNVKTVGPRGPVFMGLLEKTFGVSITTRTWDTVGKCAAA